MGELTDREREILMIMLRDGLTLDRATPGGWWLGNYQVSGKVGFSLWRKMMIAVENAKGSTDVIEHFRITSNGVKAVE
ncbi:hypothetical protein LCGC14_1851050 [marine sediment metagenome]|uniref:Uncharacterized protein n=1 Tax=marine sediment metagenome TaxID=412755 RepID=A0A0F9IPZ5_9ZZZZ